MVTIFRIVSIDLDSSCKDTVDPYDGRKGKTLYQNINIWYSFPSKDHYFYVYFDHGFYIRWLLILWCKIWFSDKSKSIFTPYVRIVKWASILYKKPWFRHFEVEKSSNNLKIPVLYDTKLSAYFESWSNLCWSINCTFKVLWFFSVDIFDLSTLANK